MVEGDRGSDERWYRVLADNSTDVIVVTDPRGVFRYVSPASTQVFRYDPGDLVGRRSYDFMHPDDAAVVARGGESIVKGPDVRTLETRFRCGDGVYRWIETTARRICDPVTGAVVEVQAACRDVTDRKEGQEAQARLAAIVQSLQDAVIGSTPHGIITSWNEGAERMFGYRADEIVGTAGEVLRPGGFDADRESILGRVLLGERVEEYRTQRLRRDGTPIPVSITVSPIHDDTGALVGIGSVLRDLTALERAEARFRALLEAAPDAVVCVDAAGTIVLVNAQAERLFGYPPADLVGQPVELLVPVRLRGGHPHHRLDYSTDPRPRPMGAGMELAALRRDGTEFPAEISLSAIETDEGVLVSAAVRDITDRLETQAEQERLRAQAERDRLEARLRQSERLESLGQLAGGVAHDFNNLLAVIQGYTSFIKEEIVAASQADSRWAALTSDVEQIERAAERGGALTHQLLAFARREVIRPEVLGVNEVVANVQQLLRRTIGEHVELVVSLAPDLPAVRADRGQLEQVLVNLAVNARDAMPGGGTLIIETGVLGPGDARPATLESGRYVRIRVADTGSGMEPDVVERAFEPFFTTKPKGKGTGLGLATVYGIISQAGGETVISSEPGVGTTVTALLPASADVEPVPAPRESASRGGHESILVVEDEDAMREVTWRTLVREGYRVLTAANGAAALQIAEDPEVEISLLLTDVVMPGMLGRDVAERVRALRPAIAVLYMSGYAQGVLGPAQMLDDGVALLEKPFSAPALLAAVRNVLDG